MGADDPTRCAGLEENRAGADSSCLVRTQVNELIARANAEWDELHPDEDDSERLLPLIRLRVRPLLQPLSAPTLALRKLSECRRGSPPGLPGLLVVLVDRTAQLWSISRYRADGVKPLPPGVSPPNQSGQR